MSESLYEPLTFHEMESAFMDEKGVGIEREADIYKREKEMTPEEEKRVDIL